MKLYRKQLNSLEALRREKIRLRFEQKHTKPDDLNPLSEIGIGKLPGIAKVGLLGFVAELLSSKSNVQTAFTLSKPLVKILKSRSAKKREMRRIAGLPEKESVIKKVVKEIAVNYFIGKAMQMAVRGIQLYMRRRKVSRTLWHK
jgi:hypothetical protein